MDGSIIIAAVIVAFAIFDWANKNSTTATNAAAANGQSVGNVAQQTQSALTNALNSLANKLSGGSSAKSPGGAPPGGSGSSGQFNPPTGSPGASYGATTPADQVGANSQDDAASNAIQGYDAAGNPIVIDTETSADNETIGLDPTNDYQAPPVTYDQLYGDSSSADDSSSGVDEGGDSSGENIDDADSAQFDDNAQDDYGFDDY